MRVALLVVLCAGAASADTRRAIPPGQEETLARALGKDRALPGSCRWNGASIEPAFIDSKYVCEKSDFTVRFLLKEVTGAVPGRDFSAADGSGAPPELINDVIASLDTATLEWTRSGAPKATIRWALVPPSIAWVLLLLGCVVLLAQRARSLERAVVLDATVLFIAALVLRLVVPWGPLDFAEPERLPELWAPYREVQSGWSAFSELFAHLRRLHVPLLGAYRLVGPVLGAATCVVVFAIARRLGVSRFGSVIAALVLATWPLHVRFSASGNPALLAAACWAVVLLFLLFEDALTPAQLVVFGAALILCIYTRPENRFVVLPLALWWWRSATSRRAKFVFAAVLGVALIPYALENLVPQGQHLDATTGLIALGKTLLARGITPDWSLFAGIVGLALPGLSRTQRIHLALVAAPILISAVLFGSEDNPLWGHWRYLVPALPLVALGCGRAFDALTIVQPRAALGVGLVLALAPLVVLRGVLLRPVDLQEEFQFVLRTVKDVSHGQPVLLDDPATDSPMKNVHFELTPAMAVTLAGAESDFASSQSDARFLYQGLARRLDGRATAKLEARSEVVLTQRVRVAPLALVLDSQCPQPELAERPLAPPVRGAALDDCEVELSWIRLR
ncbi:MAG: hypothetical protein QM817_35590 [Archangium sp.]